MASGTWGNIGTTPADRQVFKMSMIDASGDRWTEDLIAALAATLVAVQAWIVAYQSITQASIWQVTREEIWGGAMDTANADFGARFEVKNGINLSFRDAVTEVLDPIRVVAPETTVMQAATDIPTPNISPLADFITATIGINPDYAFQTAQYTIHRERRGNPKVG